MLTVLLVSLGLIFAQAQDQTVTGRIIDESGEGLPGVNVVIKGTSSGTVTDVEGNYRLSVPSGSTLVFSTVGFATQEIAVGSQSVIDVTLGIDISELQEVVVTGYSVDSRRETTGSVSTVKPKALQAIPTGNVEQALQGRVAGVTVITNGQPGTTSKVRVRGFGALGGNEPLYIVDGVPVFSTDFLAPGDIESTTVLKDATTAAIYGARAANGVIVYTTKRGKRDAQKMTITYNGTVGVTTPGEGQDQLSPQEQADWTWNAIRNAATQRGETPVFNHPQYGTGATPVLPEYLLVGGNAGVTGGVNLADEATRYNVNPEAGAIYQVVRANTKGTDWYDAMTRNAALNRHEIGISGGGVGNRYYIGLGMQEQEGIVLHQRFSRYTLRANSEFDIIPEKLRIGENVQATYRSARLLFGGSGGSGSSDDENIINMANRMSPIIPVFDEFGGYAGTAAPGFNNPENPRATLDGQKNNRAFSVETFGNVYLEAEPIENLVLKTSFGGRFRTLNAWSYTRRQYENSENNSSFGYAQSHNFDRQWVWTNTINYSLDFGAHSVGVLVGQEALNTGASRGMGASGINPFSQDIDFVTMSTVNDRVVNGGHDNGSNFSSYFGRLTYDFQDKYLFTGVIRRDGTSRLGEDVRFGTFPAFSVAWRVSEESFLSGVTIIDDLKVRAGWGEVGNVNNVPASNQFTLFGTSLGQSSYDIGGTNNSVAEGFYQTRIGNNQAVWEKAVTTNIGFDALLLDGKIDVVLDFWKRETQDMLLAPPITVLNGFRAAAPFVNVGEMENKGIDFKIVNRGNVSGIEYEVTVNGGFLSNEIVKFAEGIDELPNFSAAYRGVVPVLNLVGEPLSTFYGFKVEGLFRDQADVDGHATQDGAAPGRFKFADLDNNGTIDINDRTSLGDPIPDFTGGLTLNLKYQNWEMETYLFTSLGNEIYNISKLFTDFYPLFPGAAISSRVKDSWTFENPKGDIPIFENVSNFSTNTQSNSFYVEDGSYLRMQNISLSYYLPASILNNIGFSELKLTGSVNNVFTITGYEGIDPSVGGDADVNFGIDLGNFPITRSWNFGVSATF